LFSGNTIHCQSPIINTHSIHNVSQVESAIPAFIGYTLKARDNGNLDLIDKPMRITSLSDFKRYFGTSEAETNISIIIEDQADQRGNLVNRTVNSKGSVTPMHNMYYALQAYFANGGGPCYIVAVDLMTNKDFIDASKLKSGLSAIEKIDEVTLLILPESVSLSDKDYASVMATALKQCEKLGDRFIIMDMPVPTVHETILAAASRFRNLNIGQDNLMYGGTYAPLLESTFDLVYDASKVAVTHKLSNRKSETIATMKDYGHKGEYQDRSIYGLIEAEILKIPVIIPASSLIAGVYASTDRERGVWKAPANIILHGIEQPVIDIPEHALNNLNVHQSGKSINPIRAIPGRGTVVWGARTLAGNDAMWKYISTRRFFNVIEESVKKSTQSFVFEPNNAHTWSQVRSMISNYLESLWRQGALQGSKADEAFFVRVGLGETMTSIDIQEGRMIVEFGCAAIRPAEFILTKFILKMENN
jgi:phage tail sheath protein FI